MKKYILLIFLFLFARLSFAQRGINNLVQAEKDFAAYSGSHSTKEAFLAYADSTGLIFKDGNAINAIDNFSKRNSNNSRLNWWPLYAEVAASGDLGYTTGPWTFQQKPGDSIVARGQYSTIWHLDKEGKWKFLVDLGSENTGIASTDTTCWLGEKTDPTVYKSTLKDMLKTEKAFISGTSPRNPLKFSRADTYKFWSSSTAYSILNRNNRSFAIGDDPWRGVMEEMNFDISYTIMGSGISSTGDLGYVYGSTVINGKKENYMRVWRREKKGWRLALEVLRY